jgi:hypothetical protein
MLPELSYNQCHEGARSIESPADGSMIPARDPRAWRPDLAVNQGDHSQDGRKSSRSRCQRCGSTRAEAMVRNRHIALYKCADCGWRYGRPPR